MSGPHRIEVAAGALVQRDERGEREVLLIKRGKAPSAGLWTLPGGRVHVGETLAHATGRELEEETGLRARRVGERVEVVERISVRTHHVIVVHRAEVDGAKAPVAGDDAAGARWVARTDLDALETTRGLKAFLDRHVWG